MHFLKAIFVNITFTILRRKKEEEKSHNISISLFFLLDFLEFTQMYRYTSYVISRDFKVA